MAQGETSAKAACVLELETGRVLFAFNENSRLPMASTTKVMTALLAIENGSPGDSVTCSANAYGVPGTTIYLTEGETLTLREMLLGLMLVSGNDAAVAIAEHIGGSVGQFVAMMNARARALGAVNTHFANPHGLPDDTHVTTALDLARIARAAMQNEEFRTLVSTTDAQIPWAGRSHPRQLHNKNRLLTSYPGATGVKTGYTSRAGRCLVFGASGAGPFLLAAAVGLFLFWFGAKGVKTHSALKPALIAVPVLADAVFFAYLLFCIITGKQAMWDWQLIPSLVTDAAFAVLLALYYVHIAKEKKKEK